jgi:hypothetical protein
MPVRVCEFSPHTPNTRHKAALGAGDTKAITHMAGEKPYATSNTPRQRTREAELWHLTFRAEGDGPPVAIRVRRLLKRALRSFGLRCVDYRLDAPAATAGGTSSTVEGSVKR